MQIIDTNVLIPQIIDKIMGFLTHDAGLSQDFLDFTQFNVKSLSQDEKRARTLTYLYSRRVSGKSVFDYYLSKNDIIKLGRVKYILNEVNFISGEQKENLIIPSNKNYINEINSKVGSPFDFVYEVKCLGDEIKPEKDNEEKQLCKICYSDETDDNNPMVHLCNCKGGLNYAHFDCIKQWMKTKLIIFQKKYIKILISRLILMER